MGMGKFDFLPKTEQEKKMDDPAVKQAIRTLKSKGVTFRQIEEAFKYYERLQTTK
jgi:transposase-like protein